MALTDRLREEMEQSFLGEPPLPAVEERLAAGHRALRRRRLSGGAIALGLVAVLGTTYAVGTSGADRDASGLIASDPAAPTVPTPSASPSESSPPWEDDTPVRYVDGQLEIRDGIVVHQRIRNPYGESGRLSDALDLTWNGQRMWLLAEYEDGNYGYNSSVPSAGWASFEDWVDDQVTAGGGDDLNGYPPTMRLTDDGRVVPVAGAEVVQRTDAPDLGPDFAPAGATVGAAVVQPPDTVFSYFVVWRVIDDELDVIYTRPRDAEGATFDELLTGARAKYASGEGLR